MKRMQLVVAALAIVVTSLAAFGGPAMAEDWNRNDDFFDNGFFFGGNGFGDFEQEAESGDIDQSFEVTGSGETSNQTVGGQGMSNTGNAQNQIGVFDAGNGFEDDLFFDDDNRFFFDDHFFNDDDGDFEFDDVGSSIEVSPTNTTSSDQEVNQAATATR